LMVTTTLTEEKMVRLLLAIPLVVGMAGAALADDAAKPNAGTAKGAAVGALAGHEVGSGHAVAGAAVGAAVWHHEAKKAQNADKKSGS
jgi:hypothetical protein